MKKILRVAIDGPSGAGKSTIAKAIAKKMDMDYIDTGAMYRAVGYKILQKKISLTEAEDVKNMLKNTDIDFSKGNIILDGVIVNDKIRTPEVTNMASNCSALQEVREKLVVLQRKMGQTKSIVMDGRDIGTNVLTDAEYKIFMTASSKERAHRRWLELFEKDKSITEEQVEEDIINRDKNDTNRELNPLRKAEDAILIDTTGLSINQVTDEILELIKKGEN